MEQFHTIIIGGGPGGIEAAKILGRAAVSTALISDDLGGECLNYGCIPTKAYLWSAELFEKIKDAALFGISALNPQISWSKMQERRRDVVAKLKKQAAFALTQAKVQVINGRAAFKDAHTIEVAGAFGAAQELRAENFIIATGSAAIKLPGFESALTNREILDIPDVPKTLLIIGGGAVGAEFASIFAALGTAVTIIEHADRILPHEDSEVSAELARVFSRRGIKIITDALAVPAAAAQYEIVLAAAGRKPVTEGFGLEKAGVKTGVRGIETNGKMQTGAPHIYAIGDVAGRAMLAYSAEREGETSARSILGEKTELIDYKIIPNTIFCVPEVASVGETEDMLKQRGAQYAAAKGLFSANAKALTMNSRDGFAKILADKDTGRLLGFHIIGERASELIALCSLALSLRLTARDFAKNVFSHPVLGEVLKDAVSQLKLI